MFKKYKTFWQHWICGKITFVGKVEIICNEIIFWSWLYSKENQCHWKVFFLSPTGGILYMEKGVNMGAKFEITVLEFKEFYIPIGIQHTLMHILNKCKQKNVNIKYKLCENGYLFWDQFDFLFST